MEYCIVVGAVGVRKSFIDFLKQVDLAFNLRLANQYKEQKKLYYPSK